MKKFIFSFFLLSLIAGGAQAQKAACCKGHGKSAAACEAKAPSVASASTIESSAAAAKVAAMDQTIETRTDPITGNVTYVRKETSPKDGSVSYVNLSFDSASNSFVDVSAMEMGEGQTTSTTGTPMAGKACCSKGASSGKACCAGKAASAKSAEKTKS